jgi:hypothetical protein
MLAARKGNYSNFLFAYFQFRIKVKPPKMVNSDGLHPLVCWWVPIHFDPNRDGWVPSTSGLREPVLTSIN